MSRGLPLRVTLAAALCLPFLAPDAHAQDEKRGFSLDLYGAYLSVTSDGYRDRDGDGGKGFGFRGSYRFNDVWALEGAVSELVDDQADERFMDVSAKAYFLRSNYFEVYGLAGGGLSRLGGGTVHLGLGGEIPLRDRAFLRPEVRGRWLDQKLNDDPIMEYSLGVGWRF